MSRTIWKFILNVTDTQTVTVPEGARLLTVQVQNGSVCLWALVDPEAPPQLKTLHIYGTGHGLPDYPGDYVGTFQLEGGSLVFHVFVEI